MIRPGELRELIAFEGQGMEEDPWGGPPRPGPMEEKFRSWARLKPLTGGETVIAGRLTGQQLWSITVRWSPDVATVDTTYRIRHVDTGAQFAIKALANRDEKRQFVEFMAEEDGIE